MIYLGKLQDYSLDQISYLSKIQEPYKYFTDYELYRLVRGTTDSICDMAYKESTRELYLNNVGLPIQEDLVMVPDNYKKSLELERNYDVIVMEGGRYG